jgi:hypothetical protein
MKNISTAVRGHYDDDGYMWVIIIRRFCDSWRPDEKVGGNQTGFWGAISFPSVSVKDRSLLVPLVMLNACLTFSWPNKVPFDREACDTI